jgi:hypothetical protein
VQLTLATAAGDWTNHIVIINTDTKAGKEEEGEEEEEEEEERNNFCRKVYLLLKLFFSMSREIQ